MLDDAREVEIAVSNHETNLYKTKKRMTAKEMMRATHLRGEENIEPEKLSKKSIVGLHSLLQTC